jgi:signal transduction histidine kinase
MQGGFRLGIGHVVAFVAVALALNAQFTFWIVYSLRDNRARLDLERALLASRAEVAAAKLAERVAEAVRGILALPQGVIPSPQPPFDAVLVKEVNPEAGEGSREGWVEDSGRIAFARPLTRGRRVLAYLDTQAAYRWLEAIDPRLQLVERRDTDDGRVQVALGDPLGRLAVTPDFHRWEELLDGYRRRVVLVLTEGAFFLAALLTAVFLLWRVMRREGALERQHQNFISGITHELKTPIAGIRLALETVLSGRVDEAGRTRFLGNALADSERLASLVEKVLEVTRYAGGAHRLRIAPGDLSELVEEEIGSARRRASARGVELDDDVEPAIQAPIDPEALSIVISNLLENALKYAQGQPPRVRVRLFVERGEAILEVSDNGVGIDPVEFEAIFKPFYRSTDEVTRRTPGTGIGLYVAREIVSGHAGRLSVTSPGRGRGSTFRLALPGAEVLPEEELSEYIQGNGTR